MIWHPSRRFASALAGGFAMVATPVIAQQKPPQTPAQKPSQAAVAKPSAPSAADRTGALGNLGSNKEPIKIDSDRLDVFDREGRAVFSGSVVAVQGDSTMQCSVMTVFYEQGRGSAATGGARQPGAGATDNNAIKKIDCKGPVTIVSKTQTATGESAEFDRGANKVFLTGNVALSDGPNVTRGERIVYDLNTGVANVETKPGGRVRALFVPGSNEAKGDDPKGPRPRGPATN
jgi:lipopolysaccharide export system protein LptA